MIGRNDAAAPADGTIAGRVNIVALRSGYNSDAGTRKGGTTSSPLHLVTVLFSPDLHAYLSIKT